MSPNAVTRQLCWSRCWCVLAWRSSRLCTPLEVPRIANRWPSPSRRLRERPIPAFWGHLAGLCSNLDPAPTEFSRGRSASPTDSADTHGPHRAGEGVEVDEVAGGDGLRGFWEVPGVGDVERSEKGGGA